MLHLVFCFTCGWYEMNVSFGLAAHEIHSEVDVHTFQKVSQVFVERPTGFSRSWCLFSSLTSFRKNHNRRQQHLQTMVRRTPPASSPTNVRYVPQLVLIDALPIQTIIERATGVPVDPGGETCLPALHGQECQEPCQEAPRCGPHQALRLRQGRGARHQISQVVHRL